MMLEYTQFYLSLSSMAAIEHTKPFITTVILGSDLVPRYASDIDASMLYFSRLSLQNFEHFSQQVLHQLESCEKSKVSTLINSMQACTVSN